MSERNKFKVGDLVTPKTEHVAALCGGISTGKPYKVIRINTPASTIFFYDDRGSERFRTSMGYKLYKPTNADRIRERRKAHGQV